MKRRYALAPIGIDGSHLRCRLHHGADLRRDVAELVGLGPHHAEGDRERRGRTEHQLGDPHASLRRQAVGHRLSQLLLERVPRRFTLRQDDDLREGGVG